MRIDLDKIRSLRKTKRITQLEMAKRLGYKTDLGYHYLEKGRCRIRADQLAIIAETLKVPIEELYVNDPTEVVGQ